MRTHDATGIHRARVARTKLDSGGRGWGARLLDAKPLCSINRTSSVKQRRERTIERQVYNQRVARRSGARYPGEYAMLGPRGIMGVRCAPGVMRSVPVIHPMTQELRRKAIGTDLER